MVASGRSFDDELAMEPKKEPAVIIGVPKEVKRDEYRVGMLPVGVEELVRAGHRVLVQQGAGVGSGLPDSLYEEAGAQDRRNGGRNFCRGTSWSSRSRSRSRRSCRCCGAGRRSSRTFTLPPTAR